MDRFKVGDKVRVRKDLVAKKMYNFMIFSNEMSKFKGVETTIKETNYFGAYALEGMKLDNYYYVFTDEMLEPVEEIEKGDLIEIINGTLKGIKGKVIDVLHLQHSINLQVDVDGATIVVNLDCVKLVEKAKEEGTCSIVSFGEKCKYILQGDKTTVILPSGTKGQVKLYKGDKYDKDLGIKLAYHKAKFNEAIKEIENN